MNHSTNTPPAGTTPPLGTSWTSVGRTVTEADIAAFAGVSSDFNRLHTDEVWVREHTPFTGRIAHGMLVASISTGARTPGYDDLTVVAFLGVERRMKSPVYPGDTITSTFTLASLRPSSSRPGLAVITVDVRTSNQAGETVQTGSDTLLIELEESAS
ncbi:MaoC family dehydratase N-terminal domain-containing protein [Leucobacter allii]|uniref:MaoC family dehydratase N-terminal domain-containing protein n=1 Tax=Leucobacter allii TaxID=2932247 RepID=A0ABY4FK91_9MICO|nr:MaoC/PaaZ C-terminal domain-containing protein [Leucobacter allii]UOQ56727.1 MaoC family dehydratase N-terminal domain-containing protein [Leucobacter allii]